MIPILLSVSILGLDLFSLKLLNDKLTILKGDSLSRLSIIMVSMLSVNLLYDKFKFVVPPKKSIIDSNPMSEIEFWHSLSPRIFLCFRTYFKYVYIF